MHFRLTVYVYIKYFICSVEAPAGFSNKESVQKELKATLSQKAILSCEVSDSKTEVKWYKDGKLLTSSKAIHMESKGRSRELVIEKIEKKDAGEYTCEAGTEKLLFKMLIAGELAFICNNLYQKIVNCLHKALKRFYFFRCRREVPEEACQ